MAAVVLVAILLAVVVVAAAVLWRQSRRIASLRAEAETLRARLGEDLVTGLGNIRQLRADWTRLAALGRRHGKAFSAIVVELEDAGAPGETIRRDDIKYVAARLEEATRAEDHVYRVDSRRFAVLLADCSIAGAREYVERVHGLLSLVPSAGGAGNLYLTVVCGVSQWDGRFGTWRDHMRAALKNTATDRAAISVRRSNYGETLKAGGPRLPA